MPKPLFENEFLNNFLVGYTDIEKVLINKDKDAIVEFSFFKPSPATTKPVYLATAGGPGACKTTVLETYLRANGIFSHYVYTDPDQVALKKMNYTYGESRSNFNLAESKSYQETYEIAYKKWRGASNYIAHIVLEDAFLEGYNIAHGTTSTSPHIAKLYEKLQATHKIELLLCYAPDNTRYESVENRVQTQAFYQADPKEVITKGKEFSLRFPIYFEFADKITFYWQNEYKNGMLPTPCATWDRTHALITVINAQDWAAFCNQYHADLKAAGRPVPEKLMRYFGSSNKPLLMTYQASTEHASQETGASNSFKHKGSHQ